MSGMPLRGNVIRVYVRYEVPTGQQLPRVRLNNLFRLEGSAVHRGDGKDIDAISQSGVAGVFPVSGVYYWKGAVVTLSPEQPRTKDGNRVGSDVINFQHEHDFRLRQLVKRAVEDMKSGPGYVNISVQTKRREKGLTIEGPLTLLHIGQTHTSIPGILNLEELVALNKEVFEGMYENPPYNATHYRTRLTGRKFTAHTAISGTRMIADALGYPEDDAYYLAILAVHPEFRGQGIGEELLIRQEQAGFAQLKIVRTKVYNVSPEMQSLLIKRGYQVTAVKPSEKNSKWNAVIFEKKKS